MSWDARYQQVTCRECGRSYQCTPHDDYYARPGEDLPSGPSAGLCFGCLLRPSGLDPEKVRAVVVDQDRLN